MKRKAIYLCYVPKYPCSVPDHNGGEETLRDADRCFRSKETHEWFLRRFGEEQARKRSREHRMGWA